MVLKNPGPEDPGPEDPGPEEPGPEEPAVEIFEPIDENHLILMVKHINSSYSKIKLMEAVMTGKKLRTN